MLTFNTFSFAMLSFNTLFLSTFSFSIFKNICFLKESFRISFKTYLSWSKSDWLLNMLKLVFFSLIKPLALSRASRHIFKGDNCYFIHLRLTVITAIIIILLFFFSGEVLRRRRDRLGIWYNKVFLLASHCMNYFGGVCLRLRRPLLNFPFIRVRLFVKIGRGLLYLAVDYRDSVKREEEWELVNLVRPALFNSLWDSTPKS